VVGFPASEAIHSPLLPAAFSMSSFALRKGEQKTSCHSEILAAHVPLGGATWIQSMERKNLDQLFSLDLWKSCEAGIERQAWRSGASRSVPQLWSTRHGCDGEVARDRVYSDCIQAHRRPRYASMLIEAARRRNAHNGAVTASHNRFIRRFSRSRCDGNGKSVGTDTALTELARLEPRQALIVESRFFGGLEITNFKPGCDSEATIARLAGSPGLAGGRASSGGVIATLGGDYG